MSDFANGLMAGAAVDLAKELKVPGVGGTDVDDPIGDYMNGTDIENSISSTNN